MVIILFIKVKNFKFSFKIKGFSSITIPGAGEANFDSFEVNLFSTKNQSKEHEVHALLDKVFYFIYNFK